jgi:hypothetical protein
MSAEAQQIRTFVPNIVTPRLLHVSEVNGLPILPLRGGEQLEFSFDDLDTNHERYYYRVEHCDQRFQPTEQLLESSYLQATENTLPIDLYEPSRNTTVNYNHYSLLLPNADMRMLLPGNYRLSILREGEDAEEEFETVAEAFFMVGEQRVSINASMTTMTDADYNNRHQQLTVEVDFSALRLSRPEEELSVYVVQNRRWDKMRKCPAPNFLTMGKMKWQHCRDLIFYAGNEFRKRHFFNVHKLIFVQMLFSLFQISGQINVKLFIAESRTRIYGSQHFQFVTPITGLFLQLSSGCNLRRFLFTV